MFQTLFPHQLQELKSSVSAFRKSLKRLQVSVDRWGATQALHYLTSDSWSTALVSEVDGAEFSLCTFSATSFLF
jgi:hypothetical protein